MDLIRRPGISTVGAIGATPNAGGASVAGSTLTLQPANGSFGGVITTGTQILAGEKTWLSPVRSKPTGLAGLQLDCNGATGDFTLSLSPANLSANRRWTLPNRDDTFAGLGAQTFTGAQIVANNLTLDRSFAPVTYALMADDNQLAEQRFSNRSGQGFSIYRPANSTGLNFYSNGSGVDVASFTTQVIGAGALQLNYTSDATSTTAAALAVAGGVGIAKKLIVGTSVTAPSVLTQNVWENATNGTSGLSFNFVGFNGGTTQFRNTDFYDGKSAIVASFVGSTKTLVVSGPLEVSSATLIKSNATLTNGAAAAVGTLTNAPAAGNPSKWIPINDNGTTRYLPAW
jgi:hypothetical protein